MQHGSRKDSSMRSPRPAEDLHVEPSLREMLADPVVQALMARDGVSEEEIVQLSLAARTRLARTRAAVVMPFPGAGRPAPHPVNAESGGDPEPRTRWPHQGRASGMRRAGTERAE